MWRRKVKKKMTVSYAYAMLPHMEKISSKSAIRVGDKLPLKRKAEK